MPIADQIPLIRSTFFTKKIIWLAPNDLVRFQVQKELLERTGDGPADGGGFGENFQPWLTTFSSLEGLLAAELPTPEVDDLIRHFILNDLAEPLAGLLWPEGAGRPGRADIKALAADLADGLDRLKLAGLSWDQVATLPPATLTKPLADLGRRYDRILAEMGRADRFDRRRQVLEGLRSGRPFKALAGVEEIVCRWSQRLSPFETDFITALAHGRQLKLTLHTPAWVRDESIDHGSGFDLLRSIRQFEKSEEPGLWLDFAEAADGPAPLPLTFAAEALLAPPAYRRNPPELDGRLCIVRTSSAYTEVEEAARRLKGLLDRSLAHNLALVVPDLDGYGPLIDDVGRRFGLAFHFRRGETLADQGPVRAVLDLMALWSSNWERSRLLDLWRNPYFRLTGLTPGTLNRLTLAAGVTDNRAGGGFEDNLAKMAASAGPDRAEAVKQLLGSVKKLKKAGQMLAGTADWNAFIAGFKRLLNNLGWPGDLDKAPPDLRDGDLAAVFAFQEELDRLTLALRAPQAPAVSLAYFSLWLKSVLEERRLTYDRNPDGRIRVLNYYDLHGGVFDEIFFLGLNERVFPHIGPETSWWPDEFVRGTAQIMGRPLWNEAADSYRQQEQMLAAGLGQARRRVWLFHHAGDESGRAALPSPLLTAIKELWPDGAGGSLIEEENLPWTVVRPLAQAAGEDEMWSALVKMPPAQWPENLPQTAEMTAAWHELRRRRDQWRTLRSAAEPGEKVLAEWLRESLPQRERGPRRGPLVRPAFLAAFADCPMSFWLGEMLKIKGDDDPLEQWPTTSEGTLLHAVLEKFFRARLGPDQSPGQPWPGTADFGTCRVELLSLLNAELANLAESDPLGRLPLWQIRRDRLPDFLTGWLKREFEESESVNPWLLEWVFGEEDGNAPQSVPAWELPLSELEAVFFKGRIDRIDRDGEGLIVRDYKRRALPFAAFKTDETRLWPVLVYALAASSALGRPAEPVIEALDPAAKKHHLKGPSTASPELATEGSGLENSGFPAQLAETWRRILQGSFPPGDDPDVCRYCSFTLVCPKADHEPET